MSARSQPDVICFSHLRFSFVFQRPQQLLTRCARRRRVLFFEEPVFDGGPPRLEETATQHGGLCVATPHLPSGTEPSRASAMQRELLDGMMKRHAMSDCVLWYYTPMALSFSRHLVPAATVYDCMDELSAFSGAPPALKVREAELLRRADLVFAGGASLYEAKRALHRSVHAFPSSVDVAHFARARAASRAEPADQAEIPRPRLGFFGVLDERMDLDLLAAVAALRPAWQIVLVGPVVKIDRATLPRAPNIHVLGQRPYEELPAYLGGWDVALLPFARNEATRFISPTKTPEYLAGGRPVVSTSIRDVVRPYGELGLVRIADAPGDFVAAVEAALAEERGALLARADDFLGQGSWDATWARMDRLLEGTLEARGRAAATR
ncbi:glycosyltransferase [Sorangium sp. So ce590]|uniref:glycosyltransferase n=1 Tax=Sorangium sp. So ce590 TaxID=3133317 RepID=UPI003F630E9B